MSKLTKARRKIAQIYIRSRGILERFNARKDTTGRAALANGDEG